MSHLLPSRFLTALALVVLSAGPLAAQEQPTGDAVAGKAFFQTSCALCHADALGPNTTEIIKQGPSLVALFGRPAGKGTSFNYTDALKNYGVKWDAPALDTFLANPATAVPGTSMPVSVPDAQNRSNVIAYLATLKSSDRYGEHAEITPSIPVASDPGAWEHAAPGVAHHIRVEDLPAPFATKSSGNGPAFALPPGGPHVDVPPGFTAKIFATGLQNPRCLRLAPNGDIFMSEPGPSCIHVFRAADGAEKPSINQDYATNLNNPFGLAFYPPGPDPKWLYVANINSVVRFAYHNGDLKPSGAPEVVIPRLYEGGNGGHTTRDIAFSLDGKRMFISVGSVSNVGEEAKNQTPGDIPGWEAAHGLGADYGSETNHANILVTDPEGKTPLHAYATGIRNGVGIAVNPTTGDVWTSVNERDGMGDDLVPDYITRVKEGAFYGWPWFYLGNHEDPRWKGARPDLADKITVPDVLVQAHSASLELTFYTASTGPAAFPAEYNGEAFAAEHGSWNRSNRTGYKLIRVRVKDGVPTGEYDDFLTGFVVDNGHVWGRPVGVVEAHDGALLMSEDGSGTIWRISYTGKK